MNKTRQHFKSKSVSKGDEPSNRCSVFKYFLKKKKKKNEPSSVKVI